ncbi:hypothetical protein BGZ52_001762 [Haplosporangium bisporale]|nr:hypothetical protein BGZ52_001762 [Haplosporangium bisporale]
MDKLTPLLMNFIDQTARPPVQARVTEQLDSTKSDLKSSLPSTVMNYLTGADGNGGSNALLSQLVSSLGPNFSNKLSSVTNSTVDTASDGMDLLLTNGVLNIAKGVLTKSAGQEGQQGGGFNFDFLSQGKEGMVATTLTASAPVIKQVSENMGKKLSTHFPQEIGQALQKMVDQNGGAGGAMGMAAGLMSQFLGGHSYNSGGGDRAQGDGTEGGPIQQMLQSFLGPKILTLIQPYLQKFEAQMTASLENELRTKVFSPDFIKATVMDMLSGGNNGEGGGAGNAIGGLMNAFLKNSSHGQGGGGGGGKTEALHALGNFASQFLKK